MPEQGHKDLLNHILRIVRLQAQRRRVSKQARAKQIVEMENLILESKHPIERTDVL